MFDFDKHKCKHCGERLVLETNSGARIFFKCSSKTHNDIDYELITDINYRITAMILSFNDGYYSLSYYPWLRETIFTADGKAESLHVFEDEMFDINKAKCYLILM